MPATEPAWTFAHVGVTMRIPVWTRSDGKFEVVDHGITDGGAGRRPWRVRQITAKGNRLIPPRLTGHYATAEKAMAAVDKLHPAEPSA